MSVGDSVVGNLIATLTLDTVGFISNADSAIKKIGAVSAALTGIGAVSTKTAKTVVKSATDFETAFTGVRKTVDAPEGADAETFFTNLRQEIIDMSTELPTAATEIAGVYEAAGRYIDAENLTGFSKAMIQLASATNLSSEEATDSLAQFANVTKMSQTDFENLGSSIVALGNNMATDERQIVGMSTELANLKQQTGMSEADIVGLAATLSSLGLEAAASGTSMQRLTMDINSSVASMETSEEEASLYNWVLNATSKEVKAMAGTLGMTSTELKNLAKDFSASQSKLETFAAVSGMTTEEFAQAWGEDATSAFQSFIEGLGSRESYEQLAIFDSLDINQMREMDMLQRLAGNSDLLAYAIDMSNTAWDENTALVNEANTANSTTAAQMQLFSNNITELGITIGTNLLPVINDLLETVKPIIEDITKWAAEHPKLTTAILLTGVALGIIGGILGLLMPTIELISGAGGIVAIASALGEVFIAALPVIAVIALIGAVFLALKWAIENNFLGLGDAFEAFKTKLGEVIEGVKTYWADLKAEFDENGVEGVLVKLGEDAMNAIGSGITKALDGSSSAFTGENGLGAKIKKWISEINLIQIGKDLIGKIGEGIKKAVEEMKSTIQDAILSLIPDWAKELFSGGGEGSNGIGATANDPMGVFRASGGSVTGGSPYIVGEEGPELFVPQSSGYIIPNDALGQSGFGSGQVVINFNGDVIGDEKSIYSLVNRATKAAIRQEVRAAA